MRIVITDGGRKAAGFLGVAGDCVARSITIASGRPYAEIHDAVSLVNAEMPRTRRRSKTVGLPTADKGIYTASTYFKRLMRSLGFTWTPTMIIGSGCKVHLRAEELPPGRLVCKVSKHYVAVIDGVIHDTHDSSRGGRRCVYGYWRLG